MKKCFILILCALALIAALAGCGHKHTWLDATCESPRTCSECGETEGEALGHTWLDATCAAPKTCSVCGATQGEALAHTWVEATCAAPKTCSVCGATEGEALGHLWIEATYQSPKWCLNCGATEGEKLAASSWLEENELETEPSNTVELNMCQVDPDTYSVFCSLYLGTDFDYGPVAGNFMKLVPYTKTFHFSVTTEGVEEGYKLITVEELTDTSNIPKYNTVWAYSTTWFDKYTGYNSFLEREDWSGESSSSGGSDSEIDLGDRVITIHSEFEKLSDNKAIWKFTVPEDYDGLGMTVVDYYRNLSSGAIALRELQNGRPYREKSLYKGPWYNYYYNMIHYLLAEDFLQ